MKILKKGNYFKAYATEQNENNTRFSVGDEMGTISIKTGKFVGATACMIELNSKLDEYRQKNIPLINKAQEQLNSCGITTKIENEALYVCVEDLELELSNFEIKFRAELYDENDGR